MRAMRQTPAHTRVTMCTVATTAAVQMATYFSRTAGRVQVRHMSTVKENHLLTYQLCRNHVFLGGSQLNQLYFACRVTYRISKVLIDHDPLIGVNYMQKQIFNIEILCLQY